MSEIPQVFVQINGDSWDRWMRLEVTMGMDEIAPQFTMDTLDEREDPEETFPFVEGDEVQIDVRLPGGGDTERLFTGYIQRPEIRHDPDQGLQITATGLSKTVDLVQCHVDPPRYWNDADPFRIAEDICEPFGIFVGADVSLGANFKRFETDAGETPAAALGRIAEARGAILETNEFGNIVFTRAKDEASGSVLEAGRNIIRGTYAGDYSDRFSQYTVYSQRTPESRFSGAVASGVAVQVKDDAVTRFRPFAEVRSEDDNRSELEQRAKHLANVRAGRSRTYSCDVLGWARGQVGSRVIWRPNILVDVKHPQCQVEGLLLCSRVVLQADQSAGYRTQLDFVRREAYDPEKQPSTPTRTRPKRKKPRWTWMGGVW